MPRPKNKAELIEAMNVEFGKLCKILDDAPSEVLHSDFKSPLRYNSRDKNPRDVLIHLYEWHKMCENFITNNLNGAHLLPNKPLRRFSLAHIIGKPIQNLILHYGKSTKTQTLKSH